MANWTTLSIDDLNAARLSDLITAAQTTALGTNSTDPIPELLTKITDEIRGSIAFSGRYVLDIDATKIPATLRDLAVQKIIRLLKSRVLIPLTQEEKDDEKTYQHRLEQLNAGQWPVPTADNPATTPLMSPTQGASVASSQSRTRTRHRMSGL